MKVAMMQPTFLPWQGYFELIYKADCFIFLDDFQFSAQSFHQRNRLFVNMNQVDWYSVPVKKSNAFGASLNSVKIDESRNWRKKLLKRTQQNYSKTLFFNEIYPILNFNINEKVDSLAALNIAIIKAVVKLFDWEIEWRFSSSFTTNSTRSVRVLELLRWCSAKQYYSPSGSLEYMQKDAVFPVSDVDVLFQNFHPPSYSQNGSPKEFVPSLSVFDALFNIGPVKTAQLITRGTTCWNKWK
tara:strand:+ start:64 stop:786 length:723 start_codon:yes stop_codon:yes gene_type:complete